MNSTGENRQCNSFPGKNQGYTGEFGNKVDGLHFADDLAIYTTTRNQRVAARAVSDQQAGYIGSGERLDIFPQHNSMHGIWKEK